MLRYALPHILHLFAALLFIGTVCFEVLFLESIRKRLPRNVMHQIEVAIGQRARQLMPWVLAVLYLSGAIMAWHYRPLLAQPTHNGFGLLLALKIALAISVFGHFLTAMWLRRRGRLVNTVSRRIHLSLFCHMIGIVLLAKLMFHWTW